MVSDCGEEAIKQKVKAAFKTWDTNADGIISKNEMKSVLMKLLNKQSSAAVTEEDIDSFMQEADRNDNGVIEYDEFLDWVLRPGAKITTTGSGQLATFDLEGTLRPLYDVYDKNRDGSVTWDEFEECYCILSNSLQLARPKADRTTFVPEHLKSADQGQKVFSGVDTDGDRKVSFQEFCEWQREALANSGLHSEDLKELIPNLAKQLLRVYKLSEQDAHEIDETNSKVLERLIDNIASATSDLWNTEKAAKSQLKTRGFFPNRWTEPPVGLNVKRLLTFHMKLVPGIMMGVEKIDLQVLVLPQCPDDPDEPMQREGRVWLAQIVQSVTLKSGKVQKEEPCYYFFSDLQWRAIEALEDAQPIFKTAVDKMAPELRVFCMLKTECNFGVKMKWDQILKALGTCIEFGWLTQEGLELYTSAMESMAVELLRQDQANSQDPDQFEIDTVSVGKKLQAYVKVAPRGVMAKLSDLGIFEVNSVWGDFMDYD
jgi:Ca2+-binding EF-hand superfamily protein